MKTSFFVVLVVVACATMSAAQSAPAPSRATPQGTTPAQGSDSPAQSSNELPAGTIIPVELSKSIDAKKAKTGDRVEARLPADLLSHGKVLVPRNTKIIGHVTEVKAHSKESRDSMVGIAFDRMVMKDGRELPIQAAIQALGRPLQSAALASDSPGREDGSMPSGGGMPTAVGGNMGGSMPSRSPAPASRYPADTAGGSSTEGTPGSTVAPLGPTSQGVVGIKELSLTASGQASVVSSQTDNVHLGSGTQMILRTQ